MMQRRVALLLIVVCLAVASTPAGADQNVPNQPPPVRASVTALMVEVTISRHLAEKRLSSMPYSLSVNPGDRSSLRMGGDIPIPTVTFTPGAKDDAKPPSNPVSSYGYRSIGTNIDVVAREGADGRYNLTLTIDETSVYADDLAPATTKTTGAPAFRGFKSTNSMALRDGQSIEYTTATDRLTGEVYRVTVKMSVIK
jgi:hypothetical protein